jgi:hypothetical protein
VAQSPSYYYNNPVSGQQVYAARWCGCIGAGGDSLDFNVKAWTGANGTGSLIAVTNLQVWIWDWTTNASGGTTNGGPFNFVHTVATATAGHEYAVSAKFTGAQSVGSLEMYAIYSTSAAYIPGSITFSPDHGAVGAAVAISGIHFYNASGVWFNGTGDSSFVLNSDTSISAHVPNGATSGQVQVGNPAGNALSAASFTVVPPPTISSATPNVGTSGVSVAVVGTNFTYTTGVTIGGAAASFVVNSNTSITATVPAGAAAGVGSLVVTTPAGNASISFTVGQIFFGAGPSSLVAVWCGTGGAPVKVAGVWVKDGAGVKRIW